MQHLRWAITLLDAVKFRSNRLGNNQDYSININDWKRSLGYGFKSVGGYAFKDYMNG